MTPRLDRLERVTNLLMVLLDARQPLSLREIADRVPGYPGGGPARRQAFERDKRLLRDEGVPVEVVPVAGDDQLGYRVDTESYYLPELDLTPEEHAALNLAVAGVELGGPGGQAALWKIGAGVEPGAGGGTPFVDLAGPDGVPALPELFEAVRTQADVTFDYRGERRHVDPAGLRFHGGHWYLVAHDRMRGEARTFRVDRIASRPVPGAPRSAQVPEGFDVDRSFAAEPWRFGGGDEVTVDVLVDAVEARRVVSELGEERVVERRAGGDVVVRLVVTDVPSLLAWVLGLLAHGEVLGPPEVRAAMVARLHEVVDAQGRGSDTGAVGR